MVHKRYIRKNGKLYGPYYYESYRENGEVKKRYIGSVEQQKDTRKDRGFLRFFIILMLAFALN